MVRMDQCIERLFLSFVLFVSSIAFLSSCTAVLEYPERSEAGESLRHADELLLRKEYVSAGAENEKALRLFPRPPVADAALFNLGILYAHPRNPQKNYKRSGDYMEKLTKEYPQSSLVAKAQAWTGLIREVEKLRKRQRHLKREVEKLNGMLKEAREIDVEIERKRRRLIQ